MSNLLGGMGVGGLWSLVLGLWSGGGEEDEAMGSGIRKDEG